MSLFKKSNSWASSRRQINIKGVDDVVLILPNGKYRAVLQVSSINFELKSDKEQDAIIETYQAFLNSLTCPIQIVSRIREMDVDKYLESYRARLVDEKDDVYRQQIEGYAKFVKKLINTNHILSRQFYVVVPFDASEKIAMESVKDQLMINVNIIKNGFSRMGMTSRLLHDAEILDLFRGFYSPDKVKMQPLNAQTMRLLMDSYKSGGSDE